MASSLMRLLESYLKSELKKLVDNGIRLRAIGNLSRLSASVRELLHDCEVKTAGQEGMQLILALSYGGREEIVRAVQLLGHAGKEGQLEPDAIAHHDIIKHLYAPDVPDPVFNPLRAS